MSSTAEKITDLQTQRDIRLEEYLQTLQGDEKRLFRNLVLDKGYRQFTAICGGEMETIDIGSNPEMFSYMHSNYLASQSGAVVKCYKKPNSNPEIYLP